MSEPATAEIVQVNPPATVDATSAVHPVVSAVVQSVYSNQNVHPSVAANVAAGILQAVAQEAPTVLQLSRASPRTSAYVAIGLDALSMLIAAIFPHPGLANQ